MKLWIVGMLINVIGAAPCLENAGLPVSAWSGAGVFILILGSTTIGYSLGGRK